MRDAKAILTAPEPTATLDLGQPAAPLILSALHLITDDAEARHLLSQYVAALAPGSFLAVSVATNDGYSRADGEEQQATLSAHGIPVLQRTRAEAAALFDGLELIEPGVVLVSQWRPDVGTRAAEPSAIGLYCAVARKPLPAGAARSRRRHPASANITGIRPHRCTGPRAIASFPERAAACGAGEGSGWVTPGLAPELSVSGQWDNGVATVVVQGEIDLATVEALSASLGEVVRRNPRRLVIDLTGVAFIDPAGLHAFVRVRRDLPEHCPVVLRSPRRQVRQVFEITGLGAVFIFE